jgi:hypothetical protein
MEKSSHFDRHVPSIARETYTSRVEIRQFLDGLVTVIKSLIGG